MKKFAISLFAGMFALFAALAALAQERPADFRAHYAAIYSGPGGQPLTLPSQAAPAAVVMEFLRGKGYSADIVASLVPGRTARVQRSGLTHLRFHQQAAGLAVHDAYVKATVNSDGQLLHLIAALAGVGAGVQPAAIDSRAALDAALAELYPARAFTIGLAGRSGNMATFAAGDFFYRDPTVTRVAVAMEGGGLREGFLVETWSEAGNLLHHTLIGPGGEVLKVQLRTNNDSYNIFPDHPGNSVQTVTDGPGAGNAQSQAGWLSGNQSTIDIAGNNAHAYLDTLGNNQPDKGGSAVGDGNFLAQADPTQQPYTVENQAVAVQNLFFFNNVIHDKLYRHGFDEAAGNFQDDNFGLGGNGNDSVKAEAQDGSGINNANFATPPDGSSPRMQMFLWTGNSDHMVVLPDSTAFPAAGAEFGPSLYNNPLGSEVVAAIDGIGTATDGCEPLTNDADMAGRIALIDRGSCRFDAKVKNAQLAGAIGVIIANNQGDDVLLMGGNSVVDGVTITIPSVFIGQSHGAALRAALPQYATLIYSGALYRDGDVDSDIIYHEYGHGLTWRMIGDMSGPMSGAIGEGMSDVLAILINNNDVVAEYSNSSSIGIRSAAYTGYPRGYGDFTGGSVHFDGEIYAATIWRLWQLFQAEGIPQDTLFDYLIGGMEFTPSGPAFENMRDGILQAVSAAGGGHECLVWEAFAQFGVGTGAQYTDGVVTPSADMPPACDGTQPALDLAIASISVDTTPVFDAVANNVSVRVSNVGSGPADAFSVTLTDNGLAVGTLPVAGLASGASADLDFAWTPSGVGDHLLVASHDLADATGSNDSAMLTVAVQFRHNVAVLWVGAPATVDQGAVVAVSVGVENKGADSESFNVTLIDETAGGAVIGQQPVTGLASGTTRTLAFDWDTAGASLEGHVLTATADAVPGETYLDDNSASASSNVVAPVTGPSIDSVLPTAMDASESPLDVVILGSGFGTDPNGVTVTFVDSKGTPPVATVNAVTDSRIDITVTVKDKGKKGYFIWDMVVATSNSSDLYNPFIVTR